MVHAQEVDTEELGLQGFFCYLAFGPAFMTFPLHHDARILW